jgi:UDP-glucose 4-epimerase
MTLPSTVLVTGGAGFIGIHTCLDLLDHGYDVVVVDNYSNSSPRALDRVQKLAGRPLIAYEVDIRDRDALGEVFGAHPIDAVVPAGILNSASGAVALSQG